jgi:[ribosomal protein S5]-alanine N-acetyltransferase
MTIRKRQRLAGEKVYLRAPESQDAEELIVLNQVSKRFHRGPVTPPIDAEQYQDYLKRSQRQDNDCFMICQVSDHKSAGAINLSQIFRGNFQNAYLGYYLRSAFAGKSLMTEAIGLILRHAFLDLGLHRVEANV